jgi:hypothetical protein
MTVEHILFTHWDNVNIVLDKIAAFQMIIDEKSKKKKYTLKIWTSIQIFELYYGNKTSLIEDYNDLIKELTGE